jgi:trimeric autotransporter adhesin
MKRLITTLAATLAALAVSAGTALAAGPVQSTTQSSSTDQTAGAASSTTQVAPSNQNISVRVLSPGNDGAVSQSNNASSTANAGNTATTTQNAAQTQAGCGCIVPIKSGNIGDVLGAAMQAASPTSGPSGVQSSGQDASTSQSAGAESSTQQIDPSNSNISVRVLSGGDGGAVTQANNAGSTANAANTATTTQGTTQAGGGSGVQAATQGAETGQDAEAASSTQRVDPSNSNISVRVLSGGNDGNVSQQNNATSGATARNTAPTTQTATQTGAGSACGCSGAGSGVQFADQSSATDQAALAGSSVEQSGASNAADPVRVGSSGNDGSVRQANDASSHATATNTAPVTQTVGQTQSGSSCGCSGSGVQAAGQQSGIEQLAGAMSSTTQVGASNSSDPVRIWSDGNGGSTSQSNSADSGATASNSAPTTQTTTQLQGGSGIQAAAQLSGIEQGALAGSSTEQIGASNAADPVRVASDGNDGAVRQSNDADSHANATNNAPVTQTAAQNQGGGSCGCSSYPAVQVVGQESGIDQLAGAMSSTTQVGASNAGDPIRIWSDGNGGSTSQSNSADSGATATNTAATTQHGTQMQSGAGVQALGQEADTAQAALAGSSVEQLPGQSECGCHGPSFGNTADPVRIWSGGNDGSVSQRNDARSNADASNNAATTQTGTQMQRSGCSCSGFGVQALGQYATVDQIAAALSSTTQIGASNKSKPVRVASGGNGGSTRQSNDATSRATAPNVSRILQTGQQLMV